MKKKTLEGARAAAEEGLHEYVCSHGDIGSLGGRYKCRGLD
jgi:hypothetical protein